MSDTYEADEIRIRYPLYVIVDGFQYAGVYRHKENEDSEVEISTNYNPLANNITTDSTVDNTDILRPQNIQMFNIIVHEMTHHFQFKYEQHGDRTQDGIYSYTDEELKDPANMGNEQVASAVQDWFTISWQIENTPPGTPVNLTGTSYYNGVTRSRFNKIHEIRHIYTDVPIDDGHATVNVPQRIVSEEKAMELLGYYETLRIWLCQRRSPSAQRRTITNFITEAIRN